MAEQTQPRQDVEKEAVREITRELPDLLLDPPTAQQQTTTTAPTTVSPRQQTPQAVPLPDSSSSGNPTSSSEKTGVTTPTEKEDEKATLIDELERMNQALQQNMDGTKNHLASSAVLPEQKATRDQFKHIKDFETTDELAPKISSFQDALEMRYWTVSANPTVIASFHGAGLLQHFFGKINRRQTTVTDPHDNKPKFFAILGGPGSGKSTICSSWAKMDNSVMHIAIGDILRAEAQRPDSPYADVLKANLAKGAIGDPHMTVGLIKQHIIMTLKSAKAPIRTYLLDGFPRAKESAEYFEKNIGPISKLIFLDIPETTMIERCLLRNRADDNETAIRERIHVYRTKSADVIEHYTKAGKAVCVPQPCDSYIRLWMTFFRTTIGPQDLSPPGLLIPEAVLREVTVCGLFISRLGEIRDDLPLSSGWSGVEGSSLSGGGRGSVDVADTKGNR